MRLCTAVEEEYKGWLIGGGGQLIGGHKITRGVDPEVLEARALLVNHQQQVILSTERLSPDLLVFPKLKRINLLVHDTIIKR
jgi:hypothetical protein